MTWKRASKMAWQSIPTNDPSYANINKVNYHFNYEREPDSHYGSIELVQVGDLSCEAGYAVGDHIQESHELTLLLSGKMQIKVMVKIFHLQPGELCLSPQGTSHSIYVSESSRFQYVAFRLSSDERIGDEEDATLAKHVEEVFDILRHDPVQRSPVLFQLADLLIGEIANDGPIQYSRVAITGILHTLLVNLLRLNGRWDVASTKEQDEPPVIYQIIRSVQTHYRADIRIQDIAHELGYSYSYVSEVFKEVTGNTLQNYLIEVRIRRAKELLETKRYSIGEISTLLGYKNQQSFSRVFKKVVGCTPIAYKES